MDSYERGKKSTSTEPDRSSMVAIAQAFPCLVTFVVTPDTRPAILTIRSAMAPSEPTTCAIS